MSIIPPPLHDTIPAFGQVLLTPKKYSIEPYYNRLTFQLAPYFDRVSPLPIV